MFFIQFIDNQKTKEFTPKPADTIDDLYFAAWKCVRKANGKLSMEWSQALCKKTNANFVEISKTLNKTIDTGDIVRKFLGYDGKEYDLTGDSKLIRIIDDIVRQTYIPAFAKTLTENGFAKTKK